MSIMYVSDELLQDQTALESIASQAFSEEIMFMTEDAIFEGDGVGKPLGVLNAPCLVTVPKDSGQATQTLSLNNIVTMWARMWIRSRKNAVWFIKQDVEPQLYQLSPDGRHRRFADVLLPRRLESARMRRCSAAR